MRSHLSHRARKANRFTPRVEALEDRFLLACRVVADGSTLFITGDDRGNRIRILDDGSDSDGNIQVRCDGVTRTFPDRAFTDVRIATGDGNDSVNYRLLDSDTLDGERRIIVHLGEDDDRFLAGLRGGIAATGNLDLRVHGGDDDDFLRVSNPDGVDAGGVSSVILRGEDGEDQIRSSFRGVAGGQVSLIADGGDDEDLVVADFNFPIFVTPDENGFTDGSASLFARVLGGDDDDHLRLRVNGGFATAVDINALADGGDDDNFCARTRNVRVRNCEEGRILS